MCRTRKYGEVSRAMTLAGVRSNSGRRVLSSRTLRSLSFSCKTPMSLAFSSRRRAFSSWSSRFSTSSSDSKNESINPVTARIEAELTPSAGVAGRRVILVSNGVLVPTSLPEDVAMSAKALIIRTPSASFERCWFQKTFKPNTDLKWSAQRLRGAARSRRALYHFRARLPTSGRLR